VRIPIGTPLLTAAAQAEISGGVALRIFKVPKEETKPCDETGVLKGCAVLAASPIRCQVVAMNRGSDRSILVMPTGAPSRTPFPLARGFTN